MKKLALFFTRNVSLGNWLRAGLYSREKLIYERHLDNGTFDKVYWLTYDRGSSLEYFLWSNQLIHPDIEVLSMPWCWPFGKTLYSLFMPFVHYRKLRQADVFKTNQIDGSWAGVIAKWLYKKPLMARCGYVLSANLQNRGKDTKRWKVWLAKRIERFLLKRADMIVVTSKKDKEYFKESPQSRTAVGGLGRFYKNFS